MDARAGRYISQLLIAVNPFKQIDGLYDEARKEVYRGCNWAQVEPHVYAIAEMSFQSMTMHNQSQVRRSSPITNY